jgi:DNA (cytosine-5)-methyltransferase 1
MKLGGLFSGVGGFELAWTQLGHEVAWMCEWDAKARKVLEARFPGVPIYPDVRDLDPAEVEAVDVLTGGSPCQGFSIAGSRSGLEHSESRLFADYVRIMDGLAERGLQYAVWENVPGVLSIRNDDGERTFTHVIGALVGAGDPVRLDPKRKWNTGLAANGQGELSHGGCWTADISEWPSGDDEFSRVSLSEILLRIGPDEPYWLSAKACAGILRRASAGEGAAGGVAASVGDASAFNWQSGGDARGLDLTDEPSALSTSQTPAVLLTMRAGKPGGGKGALLAEEQSLTLATGNGQTLFQPQAFRKSRRAQSDSDAETWVEDGQANTLNVFDTGDTRTTHAIVEPEWSADETGTIQARGYKGLNHENVRDGQAVVQTYGVRRLTPVECERLQSFPDGWTEPAVSDSARYKAMGNAVTVNVVRWILGRLP